MMRLSIALLAASLLAAGCTSQAEKKMGSGDAPAPWPALDQFESGPLFNVAYPMSMGQGDLNEAKRGATSEDFVKAVDEFAASEVPPEHADKKAAKDAAVAALKDLIETAKTKPAGELKPKYEAAMAALKALH